MCQNVEVMFCLRVKRRGTHRRVILTALMLMETLTVSDGFEASTSAACPIARVYIKINSTLRTRSRPLSGGRSEDSPLTEWPRRRRRAGLLENVRSIGRGRREVVAR